MGADARGYSWPPFAAGHELSMRHGAWSGRKVDPLAVAFVEGVLERRPDLAKYPEALYSWARAEARSLLLGEYLVDLDPADDAAQRVLRYEAQFQRLAADLRGRLGLDAASEAALVRSQAEAAREVVDLDAIRERGRKALAASKGRR